MNKVKNKIYKCSVCGLEYLKEKWAKECEKWCREHKSCNLEITRHALKSLKGQ